MIEQISYEQVLSTSQTLKGSANNMQDILNTVKQKMNAVGNEDVWKGESAEQVKAKFNELASKFELFYTAINNYSKFLDQTVETYKAADKAIAGKASELL